MSEFKYTYIPVNPDSKTPALGKGFEYDQFSYGGDYRNGDLRQAGHVTHPNASLFVIDVDDIQGFLDSELGKLLASTGKFEEFVTYKSASDLKFHLYFADPELQLDADEWPVQWSSKFCYDIKSNGFVRAEPAYVSTGNKPTDFGNMSPGFIVDFFDAVKTDKENWKEHVRRNRPERQKDYAPGSTELHWEDWHHADGSPVEDFTCDYEDALRIAGQLRNAYDSYDRSRAIFETVMYESPGYQGESWGETFERFWHSMEVKDGITQEAQERAYEQYLSAIPQFTAPVFNAPVAPPAPAPPPNPAPGTEDEEPEYDEGYSSAYFPDTSQPAAPPAPANEFEKLLATEEMRYAAREMAKQRFEENQRKVRAAQWTGFTNPFEEDDPPPPSMFKVTGKDVPATAIIIPNTVTVIYGARGGGKTWTSAVWAAQELRAGHHVMWLDFERQAQLMKKKLTALGIPAHMSSHFHYSGGGLPPVDSLVSAIPEFGETLVIIDSFRDLLNAVVPSGSSNDGESVAKVYELFLNPLHAAGATIGLIDHEAKGGSGSAFGSERKESAADYVLRVEQKIPFTQNTSGFATLTVTKDRYGVTPHGTVVGALWVGGTDGKIGPSYRQYPKTPELRAWAPTTEAQEEDGTRRSAMSQTLEGRQQDDVVSYLEAQGARDGVVVIGQGSLCRALLHADALRPPEDRAWVGKQTPDKPLEIGTMKKRLGALAKAGVITKGTNIPGTDLIEWELPKAEESKTEKPSIEGFEDSEESSPPWE